MWRVDGAEMAFGATVKKGANCHTTTHCNDIIQQLQIFSILLSKITMMKEKNLQLYVWSAWHIYE